MRDDAPRNGGNTKKRATPRLVFFAPFAAQYSVEAATLVKLGGGKRFDAPSFFASSLPFSDAATPPLRSHIQTTFPSSHFCNPISRLWNTLRISRYCLTKDSSSPSPLRKASTRASDKCSWVVVAARYRAS